MTSLVSFAFLHGGGQGAWVWQETLDALQLQAGDSVRAIAFDLPGCGAKRDIDTSALSVRDVASAFVADLDQSGLKDIVLVGHSNAGTILPLAAEMRPNLIRRIIYVSCIAPPPGVSVWAMRERKPTSHGGSPQDHLRAMFCNDMEEAYANAFTAKLGQDKWPTAQAVRETDWRYDHLEAIPATYVTCLQDLALSPEEQGAYASRFHAQRRVCIDAGHQAMNTRPHALAEILLHEARAF